MSAGATVFFLVRHALCDAVNVTIAGRRGTIPLNEAGRQQAAALADRMVEAGCHALYSSPLERATETAAAIAARTGLDVVTDNAFTEIDFGDWSGESLAALNELPSWRRFNQLRSWTAPPAGELMIAAQCRAMRGLLALRDRHPGARVAVVTHADIVRTVVSYAAGTPIDLMLRFRCDPAAVSVLAIGKTETAILRVNDSGSLAAL